MTLEESKSKTVIGGLCRRIFWSLTINNQGWNGRTSEDPAIALPRHCCTNGHQKRGKCLLSHLFQKSLVTSTLLSGTTKAPCVSTRHRSENVTEFQAILQALDHLTTVPCFSSTRKQPLMVKDRPQVMLLWNQTRKSWLWANEPTVGSSTYGGNWCPNEEPQTAPPLHCPEIPLEWPTCVEDQLDLVSFILLAIQIFTGRVPKWIIIYHLQWFTKIYHNLP